VGEGKSKRLSSRAARQKFRGVAVAPQSLPMMLCGTPDVGAEASTRAGLHIKYELKGFKADTTCPMRRDKHLPFYCQAQTFSNSLSKHPTCFRPQWMFSVCFHRVNEAILAKNIQFILFILSHSLPHVHTVRRRFALYILNRHFWRHDLMSLNNAFSQLHDVFTHHYPTPVSISFREFSPHNPFLQTSARNI